MLERKFKFWIDLPTASKLFKNYLWQEEESSVWKVNNERKVNLH